MATKEDSREKVTAFIDGDPKGTKFLLKSRTIMGVLIAMGMLVGKNIGVDLSMITVDMIMDGSLFLTLIYIGVMRTVAKTKLYFKK